MLGTYHRLNVHVFASWRKVVRAAAGKLNRSARRDPTKRSARKLFYREMLRHHRDAQELVHAWRL